MKIALEPKIDFKIARNATVLLILLVIPMSIIHETGHGLICEIEGNQSQISIGLTNSSLICFGEITNEFAFYVSGGLFAMGVSLLPFFKISWIKNNPWVMIVSLSFAIGHGINSIIEVSVTSWYLQNEITSQIILNFISFSSYIVFLALFGRQK